MSKQKKIPKPKKKDAPKVTYTSTMSFGKAMDIIAGKVSPTTENTDKKEDK